jgi:hypothetical protein
LGLRLALVDASALPDDQLLGFVHAQARQLAFQQSQLWAAMAEVARRPPLSVTADDALTPERVFDLAAAEISAELLLSRSAAERELGYGVDLAGLPRVADALRAGELDRVKAVVLVDACRYLSDEHRTKVLDEILPTCSTTRVSAMKAQVQRLAIALDPDWAARRYRQAMRDQKVVHYIAEDGTVTIAAHGLPADQALAAMARLSHLAHATKRAGACATVDHLRGTLICGLIDSRFAGMNETQIIAELVAEFPKPTAEPTAEPTTEDQAAEPTDGPAEETVDEATTEEPPVDDDTHDADAWDDDELVDDELAEQAPRSAGISPRRTHRLGTIECVVRPIRTSIRAPIPHSDDDPDPPPF